MPGVRFEDDPYIQELELVLKVVRDQIQTEDAQKQLDRLEEARLNIVAQEIREQFVRKEDV